MEPTRTHRHAHAYTCRHRHTETHAHTQHTHIHMRTGTRVHTHVHTYTCRHRHTETHAHTQAHAYNHMHTYTCRHTHTLHTHAHTQAHTHTHAHAGAHMHLAASSPATCVAVSSGTLLTSGSSLPLPRRHVAPGGRSWTCGPTRLHPVFNVVTPRLTPLLLRVWHRAAPGAFTAQAVLLGAQLSSHEPPTGPSN